MLGLTRFVVPLAEAELFEAAAQRLLAGLAARPGYLRGQLGRATDDPQLWALVTEWEGVGPYRRALSTYDVKVIFTGLARYARNEPSAFEVT